MFLLLECTLAQAHVCFSVPSVILSWQFCILGFDQHSACPHFSSAGRGACCLLVLLVDLLAGSATPNSRLIKQPLTLLKKSSAPWHSLHHNLSSHHWLSLISVWFSLHSPYGLTCFYYNCSRTVEPACVLNICTEGRSMKGCFKTHRNAVCIGSSQEASDVSCSHPVALPLISSEVS